VPRRSPAARLLPVLLALLTGAVALLAGAAPAGAAPALPTVDPTAPTPTAPWLTPPPQGSAPDGSTVGGGSLGSRGTVAAAGTAPLPDGIDAAAFVVADAGTGAVLAARDPHGRYYPASTLKTLTLLTLVPRLPPDLVVQGTTEDENIEGSRVGIVAGGSYPVSLLFQGLILQSGNDAANALARAAGGAAVTVAAMNETARAIGAFDTVAGTPSGLDVAGQSSSAYDLALIFRQLLADPRTAAVLRTPSAQMPPAGSRPGFEFQSQNPLLTGYPGDLGGKTGFTDAARHTFVTAAERGGRRLVVSLMQAERRPVAESQQAARLLDWGFATPANSSGIGRLVDPGEVATTAPASSAPVAAVPAGPTAAAAPGTTAPIAPWVAAGSGVLLLLVAAVVLTVRRRGRVLTGAGGGPAPPPPSRGPRPRPPAPPPRGPAPADDRTAGR
jgi:serine-type D-Ala-D-Ala carboxypeptidase (penicillin-binding protein 5/6)